MEKIIELINHHKTKIRIITIIVIMVMILLGIYIYIDNDSKKYEVEEISNFYYYPIYENGRMGVIDANGNLLVEPTYDNIKIPNPEKAVFICDDGQSIIIQNDKKELLFSEYEHVNEIDTKGTISNIPYEKRVLSYQKDGKYGLINYEGTQITKPIYDEIESLENKEGELLVKKDGKYGVINQKGATIIRPQYDDIVADGYYTKEEKYGLSGYIVSLKTR